MSSNRFKKFVAIILKEEGGYIADDAGHGSSNFGINDMSDGVKDGKISGQPIKTLTSAQAEAIYKKNYYDRVQADKFTDELLALQLFDFSVNAGVTRAVKELQKVIGAQVDGIVGNETISKANSQNCTDKYISARKQFYTNLAVQSASKSIYLNGWLNRTNNLKSYV